MKFITHLALSILLLGLFWVPGHVYAVDVLSGPCKNAPDAAACQNSNQTPQNNNIYGPNGIITKVTRLLVVVIGVASVIMLMIGGFKYIIASGDPSNIKSAKDTILYALIGLGIALIAQAIVALVINRL